jgi:hypothetical protein
MLAAAGLLVVDARRAPWDFSTAFCEACWAVDHRCYPIPREGRPPDAD